VFIEKKYYILSRLVASCLLPESARDRRKVAPKIQNVPPLLASLCKRPPIWTKFLPNVVSSRRTFETN
jgi:hypothetical protein